MPGSEGLHSTGNSLRDWVLDATALGGSKTGGAHNPLISLSKTLPHGASLAEPCHLSLSWSKARPISIIDSEINDTVSLELSLVLDDM